MLYFGGLKAMRHRLRGLKLADMTKSNKRRLVGCVFVVCLFFTGLTFAQHLPGHGVYHTIKTSDGVPLYALEIGNENAKNTYIVLHGGFGAEHSYLTQPLLHHTDRNRFILFDQRGSLRSPAPDSLITFKNFVDDIELIRREFQLNKFNILAHSNGSTIALDYLYHHPESVEKIILIGCPLSIIDGKYFSDLGSQIARYQQELEIWQKNVDKRIEEKIEFYKLQQEDGLSGIQQTLKQKIEYAANHTHLMHDIERTQNAFFNADVFKALKRNENDEAWGLRTTRISEAMTNSKIPIVVINGEYDFVDPLGHVWPEIDKQTENLEHIMLRDAGHNTWLDQPDDFKSLLDSLLN